MKSRVIAPRPVLIQPEEIIRQKGITGLCQAADDYFKVIQDTRPLLIKPFHDLDEGPYLLCKLGLLLNGLKLGKSMKVLDFGAGSGWLSRFLIDLGCRIVLLDPSPTALEIAQEFFQRHPPIMEPLENPTFLPFDGQTIALENDSVDRIICFDAFHHVPNPNEILAEFFRILKPGGIAGFCEVGPNHSQSAQSQLEMQAFGVLENDIHLDRLWGEAEKIGFSSIYCKLFSHPNLELTFPQHLKVARKRKIPKEIRLHLASSNYDFPIFFLQKGEYRPDSRTPFGLSHSLATEFTSIQIHAGEHFFIPLEINNTGPSTWLAANLRDIGVVKLGAHLLTQKGQLLEHDFLRIHLDQEVPPGARLKVRVPVAIQKPGKYVLSLDMVSEHICWFESRGSHPLRISIDASNPLDQISR